MRKFKLTQLFFYTTLLGCLLWSCEESDKLLEESETHSLSPNELDSIKNAVVYEATEENKKSRTEKNQIAGTAPVINHALEAKVSAESTFPGYSVDKINDGSTNTTVGGDHSWTNHHPAGGYLPESVTLTFDRPKKIHSMALYTSRGYELREYEIQYKDPNSGSWRTLFSITQNTTEYRSFGFKPREMLAVRIVCIKGPNRQDIYARLNEVEIYGYAPTLPAISTENGMLSFSSEQDVVQALDYLEYAYEQYDNAFLAQYAHLTNDEIGELEEQIGYDDERPYKDFELRYHLNSKRAELSAAEDFWLEQTDSEYPNQEENPDYQFIQDDEIRTVINANGEVKVGSNYYKFNPDGSYYQVPGAYYSELVDLRTLKKGEQLPKHVTIKETYEERSFWLPCKAARRDRGPIFNSNNSWRFDYITSIWNHPWRSRVMAKTKSYKKRRRRWRKRRANIGAQVWGTIQLDRCDVPQYVESFYKSARRRKVKSYVPKGAGSIIRAFSGEIQSFHVSNEVGSYNHVLTF
ncbi:MAG: hypothetical protein AAF551_05370 [Bacteroidota bacterium]